MQTTVERALAGLRNLGTPAEMRAAAEKGLAPTARPKVNSHIHLPPNFSAFETVEQAVDLAAQQQVGVLGVSNYYDYEVYGDFVELAAAKGIFPLFGLEIICLVDQLVREGVKINDPGNPGKFYICGKGITRFAPMNDEASKLLGIIRHNDSARMTTIVDRLAQLFMDKGGVWTGMTDAIVINRVMARHSCPRRRVYLQERHACQALQERFFEWVAPERRAAVLTKVFGGAPKCDVKDAVQVQNDIRAQLLKAGKPAFVEETFVTFEQAHRLILELGGIPCYPTLADGTKPICGYEDPVEKLIERIKGNGIHCAEYIPIRNTAEVLSKYVKAMRAAGIVVTAGTEHNTLELLPIEPTCLKGQPIPEDLKEIFWEGACVVAAHQFLTLHGECGYVDGGGKLNPAFNSNEARIGAFARLGAAIIAKFQQNHPGSVK